MIKERSIVLYIILSIVPVVFSGYIGLYVLQKTQMLQLT